MEVAFCCPVPWTLLLETRFCSNKFATRSPNILGQCDRIESYSVINFGVIEFLHEKAFKLKIPPRYLFLTIISNSPPLSSSQ